jgi:hypothetical protein
MRKPVMAGNWKMYKTPAETTAFFEKFRPLVEKSEHCEIVICPPFTNLAAAVDAARNTSVRIGAQNVAWAKEGAFTGEISGPMLKAVGVTHAIIGHSERRQYFGETDETVLKRTVAALEFGLSPIVCVGERLEERESGRTEAVLIAQFRNRRRRAPHHPHPGAREVWQRRRRRRAHPLRRQREAGQRQDAHGAAGNRWRAGGRREPGPGRIRLDCELLESALSPNLASPGRGHYRFAASSSSRRWLWYRL